MKSKYPLDAQQDAEVSEFQPLDMVSALLILLGLGLGVLAP